jgi:hypothetical protein
VRTAADKKGLTVKQLANWRLARMASLVPNVLPQAEAAACVIPRGTCWCSPDPSDSYFADCAGKLYCIGCYGNAVYHGTCQSAC